MAPLQVLAGPSDIVGKLLPPPEGHRDGPGETINNNVLNSEDKLHSNSGASFVDSVPSALRES